MQSYDAASTIAMFIGAALQHPNPPCNGRRRRVSTIQVDQHKNKFDLVVVYCTLAEDAQVLAAWSEQGGQGEPAPEFVARCLDHDAVVFRQAYRKMLFLAPQHAERILARPNYGYLLFDDVATLDAWLEERREHAQTKNGDNLDLQRCWNVPDAAALRARLHKAYGAHDRA